MARAAAALRALAVEDDRMRAVGRLVVSVYCGYGLAGKGFRVRMWETCGNISGAGTRERVGEDVVRESLGKGDIRPGRGPDKADLEDDHGTR